MKMKYKNTYDYVARPKKGNSRILIVDDKALVVRGEGSILGDILVEGKMLSIDASQPTKENQEN